ncbi:MAG: hypothetical protein V7603_5136 [Micromonosporaceae bacterium]
MRVILAVATRRRRRDDDVVVVEDVKDPLAPALRATVGQLAAAVRGMRTAPPVGRWPEWMGRPAMRRPAREPCHVVSG